jgi:release factor glutamine methyltransferase
VAARERLRAALAKATTLLRAAEISSPEVNALRLAEFVVGVRPVLMADGLPDDFEPRYFRLVGQRAAHIPLQLLVGTAPFRHLEVEVAAGVFIPRPETETVAGAAIDAARPVPSPLVVDLGTGTGVIALAVAQEVPSARVVGVDASNEAVDLARRNADRLGLDVDFQTGDVTDPALLAGLSGGVDLVVANPPYVPADTALPTEVTEHDPSAALWGGGRDGLELPRLFLAAAQRLLRPGGTVVMEHDETQGAALCDAASGAFTGVRIHRDLTGRDRYLTGRRTPA